ncbi:MAG: hypothetical protein KatS3mg111_4142 [Pirellulaceae bacterium]|nr:MAG: hypothetical protein KatS3mg111_4142 [Pirellulaceae bacterium]
MASHTWVETIDVRIPSTREAAHELIDRCMATVEQYDWKNHDLFDLRLALEEALINAVVHGNGDDPSKSISFQMQISRTAVRVVIADQGQGFDPERVPDPRCEELLLCEHGRGLLLMRELMTDVTFEGTGNCVVMVKEKSSPSPSPDNRAGQ